MSDKLIPSNPEKVMVIRKVAPEILTLSVPFLRFGRIKIGGRATLGKLLLPLHLPSNHTTTPTPLSHIPTAS